MFPKMMRKKQELEMGEVNDILRRATNGVLAVNGPDGYPYAVPISFAYEPGVFYFHCAIKGAKLDAIKENDKVSFAVIDKDQIVPEEFTTYYRSVVAFGRARILTEDAEKKHALEMLGTKYNPGHPIEQENEINKSWDHVIAFCMEVEHITGKASREIMEARRERGSA